ncbi:MAG: ATP synthase F1 subunit gamma [Cyclobacteriaceae bacterium]|nr:ATP synthase F1 subunit gamma [Cyclobacteriaceae bacterium]
MASLKEVKTRISSVMSTQQITKAMKMVAAAKLRKSQDRIIQMRPFAKKMTGILQNLSMASSDSENWFSQVRAEEKILIVAMSSDRGLCGSFNSNTIKGVLRLIQEKYADQHARKQVTILPIGKKAADYFGKRGYPVVTDYAELFHGLTFESSIRAAEFLMKSFRDGRYDKIEIVYNQFKNVATQILIVEQYLPVLPVSGTKKQDIDYIFQPNHAEIMSGLIPKSLKVQLFKTLLDSNASENGARMTAMDKASENAGEILKDLKLTYNRTRQAAITKEILEIVAGAEALKAS